jgi:hypothetical protein
MDFYKREKGHKTFIWLVVVRNLILFSLLPVTVNTQETFPKRNAIDENVKFSVANILKIFYN